MGVAGRDTDIGDPVNSERKRFAEAGRSAEGRARFPGVTGITTDFAAIRVPQSRD
jgi:hypothetical protein